MKNFVQFTFAFLLVMHSCALSKNHLVEDAPHPISGKCYVKCIQPTTFNKEQLTLYKYTGTPTMPDYTHTKDREVIIKPATSNWIKKRADRNCVSPNPDDCLVWCLVTQVSA